MKASDLTALLQQSESETLDFKRDQYPFAGETVEAKGELLKDILAETERLNEQASNFNMQKDKLFGLVFEMNKQYL